MCYFLMFFKLHNKQHVTYVLNIVFGVRGTLNIVVFIAILFWNKLGRAACAAKKYLVIV